MQLLLGDLNKEIEQMMEKIDGGLRVEEGDGDDYDEDSGDSDGEGEAENSFDWG